MIEVCPAEWRSQAENRKGLPIQHVLLPLRLCFWHRLTRLIVTNTILRPQNSGVPVLPCQRPPKSLAEAAAPDLLLAPLQAPTAPPPRPSPSPALAVLAAMACGGSEGPLQPFAGASPGSARKPRTRSSCPPRSLRLLCLLRSGSSACFGDLLPRAPLPSLGLGLLRFRPFRPFRPSVLGDLTLRSGPYSGCSSALALLLVTVSARLQDSNPIRGSHAPFLRPCLALDTAHPDAPQKSLLRECSVSGRSPCFGDETVKHRCTRKRRAREKGEQTRPNWNGQKPMTRCFVDTDTLEYQCLTERENFTFALLARKENMGNPSLDASS